MKKTPQLKNVIIREDIYHRVKEFLQIRENLNLNLQGSLQKKREIPKVGMYLLKPNQKKMIRAQETVKGDINPFINLHYYNLNLSKII